MLTKQHEVMLSPSGHRFDVGPGETILEAALRSGYAVNYHCANGTCGDCRAKIIEGVVEDQLPHDYVFKGEDRNQPMLLMCRSFPGSDLVIEVSEANSVEDIPHQEVSTQVMRQTFLNEDVVELQLRTPRSQTLRFLAGQEMELAFANVGNIIKPIASCPCNGRDLMFHFYRHDDDVVTQRVFDGLQARNQVVINGPRGKFVFQETGKNKITFVAYEKGFAPIKSIIEYVLSLDLDNEIEFLWLASSAGWHYLENQCRAWRDVITNFNFELIVTDCETSEDSCFEKLLAGWQDRFVDADVYVAGSDKLVSSLRNLGNLHIVS